MPELPEVEITRRELAPHLVGRRIRDVLTSKPSYFFLTPPRTLQTKLVGRRVVTLARHGKYLLARLDDGCTLLLHLGMTGQLFTATSSDAGHVPPANHTHLRLRFVGRGPDVCFRDVRKFGKVKLLANEAREPRLLELGVDALQASGDDLYSAARKRRTPIKTLLLDQSVLAGVGNIYADEALFLTGVRPTRAAKRVNRDECERLLAAAQQVMLRAVDAGGSSIRDFVAPDGQLGNYQKQRLVYARTGQPCPRCKTAIRRVVLATRSSHYCPSCQR